MLSYYRNTIVHAYLPEAFVGGALASFGRQLTQTEGVSLDKLHEETIFIVNLVGSEYSIQYNLQKKECFDNTLDFMHRSGVISFI